MNKNKPNIAFIASQFRGNWEENFSQENGQYENQCIKCEGFFIGNKHRVICKNCSGISMTKLTDEDWKKVKLATNYHHPK